MTIKKKYIFILIFLHFSFLYAKEEICILETNYYFSIQQFFNKENCPNSILKKQVSSGSIFKIFIASAGFYFQVLTPTKENQEILNQKFIVSDNPYFIDLIKKINKEKFINFLNKEFKEYFNKNITIKDFPDDFSFVYGGKLKFYPKEIHQWFVKLAFDNKEFIQLVFQALHHKEDSISFYGKSGTWGGAAWYCGVGQSKENLKIICVLVPYTFEWKPAKEKAYRVFLEYIKN